MLLPLLCALTSTHTADAGGHDADGESPNCASHGIPTNGAPCPACLHKAGQLVAPPIPSAPPDNTSVPSVPRRRGPGDAARQWLALGPPTGGHQDIGASYA